MTLPRFYPILDTSAAARANIDPLDAARQILGAGAQILQFRQKHFLSRDVFELLSRIAEETSRAGALLVVNDRADLAKRFAAALHLGQDDLPPAAARRVVGAKTKLGFSTHNEDQLRCAAEEPADYIALGPMFGTASKENPDPVVGVDELRRLRPLTKFPLVAIGGITRANARQVIDAGADSVAVIGDLFADSASGDRTIYAKAAEWLRLLK